MSLCWLRFFFKICETENLCCGEGFDDRISFKLFELELNWLESLRPRGGMNISVFTFSVDESMKGMGKQFYFENIF